MHDRRRCYSYRTYPLHGSLTTPDSRCVAYDLIRSPCGQSYDANSRTTSRGFSPNKQGCCSRTRLIRLLLLRAAQKESAQLCAGSRCWSSLAPLDRQERSITIASLLHDRTDLPTKIRVRLDCPKRARGDPQSRRKGIMSVERRKLLCLRLLMSA